MFAGRMLRRWIEPRSSKRNCQSPRLRSRLLLAPLEERAVPTVYTVNTLVDENDGIGVGGISLRDAVVAANADGSAGPHVINFSVTGTINLTNKHIPISAAQGLSINGPGAALLTLDGTGVTNARAFNIDMPTAGQTVSISGLTIENFSVTGDGGGINNIDSSLTLTGMVIKNNFASTDGGGINMESASSSLTLINSVLANNTATAGDGGGINAEVNATISISKSSIRNNSAASTTTGDGGGIFMLGSGVNTLTITDSTLSGNQANHPGTAFGGGALYFNGTGTVTLTNSTVSSNTASAAGGGFHIDDSGTLNVFNSTIYGNTATANGGGINLRTGTSALNLVSSIVAGNSGAAAGPDLFVISTGTANIGFSNLGNSTGSTFNTTGPNLLNIDPVLAVLGDNGGFLLPDGTKIETHAVQTGSPVLDQGSNPQSLLFDQRGTGFDRAEGSGVDIGAFELFSTVPSAKATAPAVPPALSTITVTVEYTDESGINAGGINTNDIRLKGPAFASAIPTSANFTGSGTGVTATYVFNAPAGGWQWFHDGVYSIEMQANEVFDTDGPTPVSAGKIGAFTVALALPNPLVVDNVGDSDDGIFSTGNLTLREAVNLANITTGQPDTITLAGSLAGTPINVGSALKITDSVSISAANAANFTISGGGVTRVFELSIPGVGGDVSLSGMTVTSGNSTTGVGGGISLTDENLTLTGMVVTSNTITGAGGGIGASGAASITVGNSTISNNSATTTGGGIHLVGIGAITINNSSINNNIATTTGGAIHTVSTVTLNISDSTISANQGTTGGGVRVANVGSTTTVTRSTVSGNIASASGGGFYVTGGTMVVSYSTFSGNTAGTSGGGIGMTSTNITVTNSTFSGNFANGTGTTGGGGLSGTTAVMNINNSTITGNSAPTGVGGGIRKTSATGAVTLQSTIVGANTASAGNGQDIHGTTAISVAGDNNLIQDNVAGAFTLTGVGNVVGLDPLLNPLGSNGGPTQTHSLQSGSPASNAGNNAANLSFDQRGTGNPRVLGGTADIGSLEANSTIPSAKATAPNVPPTLPDVTVTVVYTDETGINTTKIDTNDIRLSGPGYASPIAPSTANFAGSGTSVTATYVFPTPVGGWDPLHNGDYTITMQANEVFDTDAVPNPIFPGTIGGFKVAMPLPPLVVDKIGDDVDGNYTTGQLTFREAIGLTNGSASTLNFISFAASLFAGGSQSITMTGGEIEVTKSVTITGPGANKLTMDAGLASRIFKVVNTTEQVDFSVSGMTLANGSAPAANDGGAIFADNESVTVDGVVVRDSQARYGGGIFVAANTFGGGAILMNGDNAHLLVRNSTLTNNMAPNGASNSGVGGAIVMYSTDFGVTQIENSTITNNSAGQAGGVRVFSDTASVLNIISSIISGNSGSTQLDLQTGSTPTNITNSLIGSDVGLGTGKNLDAFSSTNLGANPMLGSLQDNGGATPTIEILAGSPAINNGSNPANLSFDQRGTGFVRNSGGGVDIGAFEIQSGVAPPQVTGVTFNNGLNQRSMVTSVKVSFSEAVTLGTGAFVLERFDKGAPGTIGVTVNQVGSDVTLTFNNTGSITLDPGNSLPDGKYQLTIVSDNVAGAGGKLDGNKNGTAEGSPIDNVTSKVHRLFGDGNGDGTVNSVDFAQFRSVFGLSGPSIFDFNNDNNTGAADFAQFRARFGLGGFTP